MSSLALQKSETTFWLLPFLNILDQIAVGHILFYCLNLSVRVLARDWRIMSGGLSNKKSNCI
jgi:hypothetical protein